MASRLQLDLGTQALFLDMLLLIPTGRETLARMGRAGGDGTVDGFRTIGFDDWLRLFMQASMFLPNPSHA